MATGKSQVNFRIHTRSMTLQASQAKSNLISLEKVPKKNTTFRVMKLRNRNIKLSLPLIQQSDIKKPRTMTKAQKRSKQQPTNLDDSETTRDCRSNSLGSSSGYNSVSDDQQLPESQGPPPQQDTLPLMRNDNQPLRKSLRRRRFTQYQVVVASSTGDKPLPRRHTQYTERDPMMMARGQRPPSGEYTVEFIESVEVIHCQPFFCVKWLGYDQDTNTWETYDNLVNCAALVKFVADKSKLYERYIIPLSKELEAQLKNVPKTDNFTMMQIDGYDPLKLQIDLILLAQYEASGSRSLVNRSRITERALLWMQLRDMHLQRRRQLKTLAQFEKIISNADRPSPGIKVENNVDLERIDANYVYSRKNIWGSGVPEPRASLLACKCSNITNGKLCCPLSRCCARLANELFAYNKATKRLRLTPGNPIIECNSLCSCDSTCPNRVVQNGRRLELVLFKTSNGCGWGVRTVRALAKGEFVCEYIGEIITSKEADERGKLYENPSCIYLFALDYNLTQDEEYTIDATNYGNIARYLNHSCDPNISVFPCWIEHSHLALPRLVFFTVRSIKAGEELCFDYIQRTEVQDIPQSKRIKCLCGAKNCRKVVF
ncbi:histone-lysine N-methyltransferase Su(var)3-9-like [Drosophila tropicalis]|uniref:histone-lysine N-methyltransferase Su(var)3-9-like n=1 Tax=Drosophila tropicalis TaxID=46794 RepID=UPI0035ABB056